MMMQHMPPPIRRPVISISTQKNQADVGKCVRDLLVSTKRLQDLLEQWSRGQADETHVSDVFVEVGTNFNSTIRAFAYYHIDLRYARLCCACSPLSVGFVLNGLFQ
jgi:hypothetical protein